MDQVVRALRLVAESRSDTRRAAACIELAICYACDLVESGPVENPLASDSAVLKYLVQAAELGDVWARAIVYQVFRAMNQSIPADCPIKLWLFEAASKGARIALTSLEHADPTLHKEALRSYRSTFCGNPKLHFSSLDPLLECDPGTIVNERRDTFLHWMASTGQVERLGSLLTSQLAQDVINRQNIQGDTPLLCAVRAGHHENLMRLVGFGADASIRNTEGENALHFLGSLDENQVFEAAQLLISAGADIDANASTYTGNTYLETRPTGKGCPKLRAVMLDQPHVLRALLKLDIHFQSLESQSRHHATASSQRLMLTWALRLRQFRTLQVLLEYFYDSPAFLNMDRIRVWYNGRRYSLLELCILGNVSCGASAGFDVPDRFWRYMNYGEDQWTYLKDSLAFLADHGSNNLGQPCQNTRNALFFAIAEGNRDAVQCLLSHRSSNLDSLFPMSTSRKEIRNQFLKLDAKIFSKYERLKNNSKIRGNSTLSFLDNIDQEAYGPEDREAYASRAFSRRRERQQRDLYLHRRPYPFLSDTSDLDSGETSDEEESDMANDSQNTGVNGRSESPPASVVSSNLDTELGMNSDREETSDTPMNHEKRQGLVDAVLLAIVYGQREIFYDLITGPGCMTIQPRPACPCFVYMGKYFYRAESRLIGKNRVDDLRGYFPEHARKYLVARTKLSGEDHLEFDGNLCYPLLYMTAIARSHHRDIRLA